MRNSTIPACWAAHEALVAPARARPELWRVVVGSVLIVAVVIALNSLLAGVLAGMAPDFWLDEIAGGDAPGRSPAAMLVLLLSFGFFAVGAALATNALHGRPGLTLLGPLGPAWAQFRAVLAALVAVSVVILLLPPYATGLDLELNLPPATWIALLPLSLVALLVQVSAEEIVFRGYLQSQLAARFTSPLIWMVLPALLFGAGHYVPAQAGENALLIALWAVFFGLLMADLTARAGTLGPAIAVHLVNNIAALLFMSVTDEMNGLALYVSATAADDPALIRAWLPVDVASMVVLWLTARLALRR